MIDRSRSDTGDTEVFSKKVDVSSIPRDGRRYRDIFKNDELKALADAIGVQALENIDINLELRPLSRDRLRVHGHVRADVTQLCVVTVEPVHSRLDENIDCEFWPEQDYLRWVRSSEEESEAGFDAFLREEPEPYRDGEIDIGQFIYETIVAAIDPYPRKNNVEFNWDTSEFNTGVGWNVEKSGPFSKLRTLIGASKGDKSS